MYVVFADGGGLVGAEYAALPWLSTALAFGGYAQRPLRRNWLTRLELRARKTLRVGPVFEGFVSAGWRHIVVEGDSFSLGSEGELVKESRLRQSQFAGSVGLGFGGSLERHNIPLRIVLCPELLFSAPYFQGSALDLMVALRVSYRFGASR